MTHAPAALVKARVPIGPALPEACDALFERAIALIEARDAGVRQLRSRGSGSL